MTNPMPHNSQPQDPTSSDRPPVFQPPPLNDQEVAQFGGPGAAATQQIDSLNVGDEVNVVIRGRVVERGREMCTIDLVELLHQGRIDHPLLVPMPVKEIRSKPRDPRNADNKGVVDAMKKPPSEEELCAAD